MGATGLSLSASGVPTASPRALWERHLGEGDLQVLGQALSGPWRLLLLGDGSPTRHLESLTGLAVRVQLIAMTPQTQPRQDGARPPLEVGDLALPLLRRQVWLCCGDRTLAWAESWWNQGQADAHLQQREQPIWRSLTSKRAELFREVDGLALVQAPWLVSRFGHGGPFWSRHYRFFRGGEPLTVIREVFSPELEQWLGPAAGAPVGLGADSMANRA
ncbi:MAG: chorismate lyase [Cyanobacteria bacterium J06638_7]